MSVVPLICELILVQICTCTPCFQMIAYTRLYYSLLGEENVVTRAQFEHVLEKERYETVAEEGKTSITYIIIMLFALL